jgi:hypothetical protein
MELKCTNCGEHISAENINIQKTLAVCDKCDHVFNFGDSVTARKAKQQKARKPENLHAQEDDDRLELSYQQLVSDPNEKIGLAIVSVLAIILTLISIAALSDNTAPLLVRMIFSVIASVFWYIAAVTITMKTRINIDREKIAIKSGPLPFPINDNKTIDYDDVSEVFCEETEDSKKRAAFDRYHRVCMRFNDGNRVALIKSLPQDFAFYIAQSIESYLPQEEVSDLVMPGNEFHDDSTQDEDDLQIAQILSADEEAQDSAAQ